MVCSANSLPEKTPNLKSTTRSKGFVKGIVLKHPFVGRLALHLSNENCVSQTLHILNWQLHPSKEYYNTNMFFCVMLPAFLILKLYFIKHVSYVSDACVHKALHWRNVAAIERRGMFCMDIFFLHTCIIDCAEKNPQVFTFEKNPFVCKQMHTLLKKHCACGTGSLVFLTEDCFLERSVHWALRMPPLLFGHMI